MNQMIQAIKHFPRLLAFDVQNFGNLDVSVVTRKKRLIQQAVHV
jgi:hypothetical protein